MCLKSITRVIENPTLDELVGFKSVFIYNDKPYPPYYKPNGEGLLEGTNFEMPVNIWLQASSKMRRTEDLNGFYETGFHIFTNSNDAYDWGSTHATHVIEVKYRLVTHYGIETLGNHVHIAREMYIPWPQVPIKIE